jgi:hypothetical protein
MFWSNEVDVVTSIFLELNHHLCKDLRFNLSSFVHLANIVILAKDTAEVAHGKEDRPTPLPSPEAVLLSEVRKGARNLSITTRLAGGCFVFETIYLTISGASLAGFQFLNRFLGSLFQFSHSVELQISRFKVL